MLHLYYRMSGFNFKKVLEKHSELKSFPNVLNVGVGTKWVTDKITGEMKDTGIPSIVVYVIEKKELKTLKKSDRIPKEIEGIPVDVVELSSEDFELTDTSPSKLSFEIQRKIAGGVKK